MAKKKNNLFVRLMPSILIMAISGYSLNNLVGDDLRARFEDKWLKSKFVTESTYTPPVPTIPVETTPVVEETETETEEVIPEPVILPEERNTLLIDNGYPLLDIDFPAYNRINEDVVGYIQIPNTVIEYPVVQGTDNDYYLHHAFDGGEAWRGSVFVDSDVDLSKGDTSETTQDRTISMYAHYLKDGGMFKDLHKFKKKDFFEENPYYAYYSEDGSVYGVEVFGVYITSGESDKTVIFRNIDNEENLEEYMNFVYSNAINSRPVDIGVGDKIVALVTCSYEHDNYRVVVVGKATKQYLSLEEAQNDELNLSR